MGGSHCQYAAPSLGCTATEKLCGAHPNITRAAQQDIAIELFVSWLAFVDGNAPFASFKATLDGEVASGKVELLASDWSGCN